jgi:hypothetical protein
MLATESRIRDQTGQLGEARHQQHLGDLLRRSGDDEMTMGG